MNLLQFMRDATTISLVGTSPVLGCTYRPNTSDPGTERTWETVTVVLAGTAATLKSFRDSVQRLLNQAWDWDYSRVGSPVIIRGRMTSTGNYAEAIVYGGVAEWRGPSAPIRLEGGTAELEITFQRQNSWDEVEASLPLTNSHGTNVTTGLLVDNAYDGSHSNYVEIAAASIGGDIMGPTRVEMENVLADSSNPIGKMIVGCGYRHDVSVDHIIEGEDSTLGTYQASASMSNGAYRRASWSGYAETTIFQWTLSSALLAQLKGNLFRFVAQWGVTVPQSCWLQLKLKSGTTNLWESAWIEPAGLTTVTEFSAVRLPPWIHSAGSVASITLTMVARSITGTSIVDVDFLMITPLDRYRVIQGSGRGYPNTDILVDDGFLELLYSKTAAGLKMGDFRGRGGRIMLEPNQKHRLYFMWMSTTLGAEAFGQHRVRVYHRPRRFEL